MGATAGILGGVVEEVDMIKAEMRINNAALRADAGNLNEAVIALREARRATTTTTTTIASDLESMREEVDDYRAGEEQISYRLIDKERHNAFMESRLTSQEEEMLEMSIREMELKRQIEELETALHRQEKEADERERMMQQQEEVIRDMRLRETGYSQRIESLEKSLQQGEQVS